MKIYLSTEKIRAELLAAGHEIVEDAAEAQCAVGLAQEERFNWPRMFWARRGEERALVKGIGIWELERGVR